MSATYSEKLTDPRWQKLRLEVFSRDGWKCLCCEDGEQTLHIHHLIYSRGDPWESPAETLETLCKDCHAWREQFNNYWGGRSCVPTGMCQDFENFFTSAFVGEVKGVHRHCESIQHLYQRLLQHHEKLEAQEAGAKAAIADGLNEAQG